MYVVRHEDLVGAIDRKRKLVKLSDPNLWKPAWPEGAADWKPGHEIRSDAVGISLFTTGTVEEVHYHERTWEVYQVLRGSLRVAVRPHRRGGWRGLVLDELDLLLLSPGTIHLVDAKSRHTTQVIQAPPALSDQVRLDDLVSQGLHRRTIQQQR